MLRGVVLIGLATALWAAPANACDVQASSIGGSAPLAVTYTATCQSAAYHWSFGDGAAAEGRSVSHTFAAGRWSPTLQTDAGTDALPDITAVGIRLTAPRSGGWGKGVVFSGSVTPALQRVRIYRGRDFVTAADTDSSGRFRATVRLSKPGPYTARIGTAASAPVTVLVKPVLDARLVGTPSVGATASVVASVTPAAAGAVRIVSGDDRKQGRTVSLRLDTSRPAELSVQVETIARPGYATSSRTLQVSVVYPDVGPGSTGTSVRALEQRLAALRYALLGVDSTFGQDTTDAVYAFQKVQGLRRTGRADAAVWAALGHPKLPVPKDAADHVEVDKARQVLYLVRGGKIALIVPVSTAGLPGKFTPVGRFSVYRKVDGFDPSPLGVLYDPSYFVGGYAIHGNPSVPPYPASHGCVRIPMWVAARVYSSIQYGETVDVY